MSDSTQPLAPVNSGDKPKHADDCAWHFEQYPWECICGAIPTPDRRSAHG